MASVRRGIKEIPRPTELVAIAPVDPIGLDLCFYCQTPLLLPDSSVTIPAYITHDGDDAYAARRSMPSHWVPADTRDRQRRANTSRLAPHTSVPVSLDTNHRRACFSRPRYYRVAATFPAAPDTSP